MGFLTDVERQSLQIEAMILHVVGEENFAPEPARQVEHAAFFVGRVLETDVAAVYAFKEVSNTRSALERIACGDDAFEAGAQALSREFSRFHGASTRDGAFFIFALRSDHPNTRLYSMIKYDYREAIEQTEDEDGQQRLRRIIHAFIDDKRAIQKSALIRVVDGQAEVSVAARDRSKPAPEIADYFATFLDVERSRNDNELNQALVETLRKTFQESKDVLPGNDVARAMRAAKATLRDRQEINEQAVVEAVLAAAGHPRDEEVRGLLQTRTAQKLRTHKLTGLVFRPDRQILRKPPLRKLVTTEGVTVLYPDEADAVTVRRERNPNGGGEVITITTDRIVEDSVVRDPAR
ncbi:hypothetical protein B0E47_06270 [Rhodanobacter sp. B05]|uniref:nucleoid-associated protein n=1 Tax=Rhodanobacter sp. B05 TaxID=1945859 RepID=UPI000984690D|nr:nucleoid-associated protein [Rhodanobacter sp. B05]OOG57816.1 hypothetical protein B0E47_06270 [Rhodanobacter sp. B05]